MGPEQSYIICATPRSGSFLLCEALICTEVAGGPGEYFWRNNEPDFMKRWGATNYSEYVQGAIRQGTTPNGVFGVKIMRSYLDEALTKMRDLPELTGRELRDDEVFTELFPNLQYIWMTRRDKVRQAISWSKAGQTGIWAQNSEEAPKADKAPEYRFDELNAMIESIVCDEAAWNTFFEAAGVTPHVLVYEDFVRNYEEALRGVLAFLNIPAPDPIQAKSRVMRKQADSVSEEWYRRWWEED